MSRRFRALVAALPLLGLCACANHVRYREDARERVVEEVLSATPLVEAAPLQTRSSELVLRLAADETVRLRRLRTHTRIDEVTPWRSAHEAYEVPIGVVALPVLAIARAGNTLLLRVAPDAPIRSALEWSAAAANPLLNCESRERVRREPVSRETEELESWIERRVRPLAGASFSLGFDSSAPIERSSDARGELHLELVEVAKGALAAPPRRLVVTVRRTQAHESARRELAISAELGRRLMQAVAARERARVPGISADEVALRVTELEELGFADAALHLEDELRARPSRDPRWQAQLDAALRRR